MQYQLDQQNDAYVVRLSGDFTFSDNGRFRNLLMSLREVKARSLMLVMDKLSFIDSAALGMLLLLHDEATRQQMKVTMSGVNGQIKKMLQLSNFDEIFDIRYA